MLNKKKYMDYFSKEEQTLTNSFIEKGEFSILSGGILEEFENKAAVFFGNKYGVSTCNGTSAIYLSLFALNIQKNDEIIIPVYAFHGIATAICCFGAKPIFCDIDSETLTINTKKIKGLINKNTKAIMVLEAWGNISNIDELLKIKKNYNLRLISDSSHAHGALWNKKPLGEYFDIIIASFGKGKLISGGELGILTTNNKEFYERSLLFSHVNRVPDCLTIEKYKNIDNAIGIKFRPHAFALFLALLQMKKFPYYLTKIKNNIRLFEDSLEKSRVFTIIKKYEKAERVYWKFPIKIKKDRYQEIIILLKQNNILFENNHYKKLLNENTIYTNFYNINTNGDYKEAIDTKDIIIQLPEYLFYNNNNVKKFIKIFNEIDNS